MKLNCIIVDDEHWARVLMQEHIEKIPFLEIVGTCNGVAEALQVMDNNQIDLIFLDIQMPDMTGIDFIGTLNQKPLIILTTAYPEYAVESYGLDVADYLLKPIAFDRFLQSANKVYELKNEAPFQKNHVDFITIKSEHRIYRVKFVDIMYIEGANEYVIFYLKSQKKIITLMALKNLEIELPDEFIRIHRSYIVNKNQVVSLYGNRLEVGEKLLDIGKTFKSKIHNELFRL
ncbi:MAG: DNA-binding LytR/AlgR family response regulator [Crocinitomix sp.]|jgi:DNA-binding LytR/AlgR family response regulator